MHETEAELAALQQVIDASFERAGEHLTSIIEPPRRLSAREAAEYLTGVKHLVVATTNAAGEPRVSAVDGLFLHASFWFSTAGSAVKARHLEARPPVSAAHVRGDDIAFFVHGTADVLHGDDPAVDVWRPYWREVYDGSCPDDWVASPADARYVRLQAHTFLTYCFDRSRFESLLAAG